MHISVKCCFDVGMTENLAESFCVKTALDTSCGEGMAQCVEGCAVEAALLGYSLESVLHKSRLNSVDFFG